MKFLYAILFSFIIQVGYAQKIIPRLGVSLAKTSKNGSDTEFHHKSERFHAGVVVGLGYETLLNRMLNLYTEITYIQKGQKSSTVSKNPNTPYVHNRNYSLDFLEVPILLRAEFNKKKLKFYPHIGVTVGYGMGGKMDDYWELPNLQGGSTIYAGNFDVAFEESERDIHDGKVFVGKPLDIGIQAGGGILLLKKIILDIRYTFGLKGYNYFENDPYKNRVLQFSVSAPISL